MYRRDKVARIIENPRKLILEKAKKILYNDGYSSISIRRVAKECDIAVGTIYNYFPGKKKLIVEMMANFWDEYFSNIESILDEDKDFYIQLRKIFNELSKFITKFREVWLDSEIYSSPDYIESGLKKQDIYLNKLAQIIEKKKKKNMSDGQGKNLRNLDIGELSNFIIANFIAMLQMNRFKYDSFEKILKELI